MQSPVQLTSYRIIEKNLEILTSNYIIIFKYHKRKYNILNTINSHDVSLNELILNNEFHLNPDYQIPVSIPKDDIYFKAFYHNPDSISITTLAEGRYLAVNDAYLEVSGYKRHELIGKTVSELSIWVHPEDRERVICNILKNRISYHSEEKQFHLKTGEIRTFLFSTKVVDINDIPCLLFVSKDITGRKKIEESLRISENKFSKAFLSSPTPMSISQL